MKAAESGFARMIGNAGRSDEESVDPWLPPLAACSSDKAGEDGVLVSASEDTCDPGNMPPFTEITSHSDGDYVEDGATETFRAFVGSDDELSSLTVNW